MEYKPGQRVRVVQQGTMYIGGLTMTDCTFEGVTIVRRNPDGTYQVRGILGTPTSDEVTIPAAWIYPLSGTPA